MKDQSWALKAIEAEAKNRAYRELLSNPDAFRIAGLSVPQIIYLRWYWMTNTHGDPRDIPTKISTGLDKTT